MTSRTKNTLFTIAFIIVVALIVFRLDHDGNVANYNRGYEEGYEAGYSAALDEYEIK